MTGRLRPLLLAGGAYLLVVLFLVVSPRPDAPASMVTAASSLLASVGLPAPRSSLAFVFNVLLFIPLGLLGSVLFPRVRWWGWAAAGLAFSALLEATQWVFLPDRSPTVSDLVANTAGCVLGAVAAGAARRATGQEWDSPGAGE